MTLKEAKQILKHAGYSLLKEWGVHDAGFNSPVRYDSGDAGDESGSYYVAVELQPTEELVELSKQIFNDPDVLTDILQNFDFPAFVSFDYNENVSKNNITNEDWYDHEADNWFTKEDTANYLADAIEDQYPNCDKAAVAEAMPKIQQALQNAANKCCTVKCAEKDAQWEYID